MAKPPIESAASHMEINSTDNGTNAPETEELQCVTRIHLLIVDDDAPTCQVIQTALAHDDFHIRAVSNVSKIEAAIKSATHYHIIILDYVLPGLNTRQVLGWIREHQPDAALIIITGYPSMEGALSGLRARAYDYLTKPFQIAELRATVLRCLQSKGLMRLSGQALCQAVGAAIRDRRKVLKMTLETLAKRIGISLGYLSQIERGEVTISLETLYRASLIMGVRMTDFLQEIEPQ